MYCVLDQALMTQSTQSASTGKQYSTQGFFAAAATSRFGIKGERDLGDGLKGVVQFEQELAPDESTLFSAKNRTAFVGLNSHNYGSVKLGTQETLAYELFAMDVNGRVEYKPQVWRYVASESTQDRMNNMIKFQSNKYEGISAAFIRGFGETVDGAADQSSMFTSIGLNYENGAFKAKYVWDALTNKAGGYNLPGDPNAGVLNKDQTSFQRNKTQYAAADKANPLTRQILGATYDFGVASVNYIMANAATAGQGSMSTNTFGVRVPMDKVTVALSVGSGSYATSTGTIAGGSVSDTTFGGYYNLDKSTSLYLLSSVSKNTPNTTTSLVKTTTTAGAAGTDITSVTGAGSTRTVALGVRYNF